MTGQDHHQKFLNHLSSYFQECFPLTNYLENQQDITAQMRAILVDWLVEVQECFELYHETLYLGVKLLDHFLEGNTIKRDELQLVGATTLLISSKIEVQLFFSISMCIRSCINTHHFVKGSSKKL